MHLWDKMHKHLVRQEYIWHLVIFENIQSPKGSVVPALLNTFSSLFQGEAAM